MKLKKLFHIASILVGIAGSISFVVAVLWGADNSVFGVTKIDALLCSGLLLLIAIWIQVVDIHYLMRENKAGVA